MADTTDGTAGAGAADLDDVAFGPVDLGFLADEPAQAQAADAEPARADAPTLVSLRKPEAAADAADDAPEEGPDEAPDEAAEDAPPAGRPRRTLAPALVGALGVAVVALAGWLGLRIAGAPDVPPDPQGAVQAAITDAATFFTYDYQHLSDNKAQIEALLTPEYRATYDAAYNRDIVTNYSADKVVMSSVVRDAGLETATGDTAVVLAYLDQKLTDVRHQGDQASVSHNRLRLTFRHSGNRWLLGKIDLL